MVIKKMKRIVNDRGLLFSEARNSISKGYAASFFVTLNKLYKSSFILSQQAFLNITELENELNKTIKNYASIIKFNDYSKYVISKNKQISGLKLKKEEKRNERILEKRLQEERLSRMKENKFLRGSNNDSTSKASKKNVTQRIRKEKVDFYRINRELLSHIMDGTEIPGFTGIATFQVKEIITRLSFSKLLNEEQYYRYRKLGLLYLENNVPKMEEINKAVLLKEKNMTKPFSPNTHVIYHKNGK